MELTGRENQVLRRVREGRTNKQIAADLGIAPKTVEFHVTKLLRKHAVSSRFDLMEPSVLAEEPSDPSPPVAREALATYSPDGPQTATPLRDTGGYRGHSGVIGGKPTARHYRTIGDQESPIPVNGALMPEELVTPQAPRLPWASRVWGVVVSPARTFKNLAEHPDVATPLAAIGLSALLMGAGTTPQVLASLGKIGALASAPQGVRMGIAVFSAVFVGVETVVGWVLGSLVIYLVAKLLSGRGTPRAALSVFGFAMLPTVAQNVVRAVQGLATGSIPTAGLTDAFPKVTAPVLKVALSTINIFGLWGAVLMVLAVSAAFGMSRKKSALMMACFWAIGFAFQVVVTGAAARIGGA